MSRQASPISPTRPPRKLAEQARRIVALVVLEALVASLFPPPVFGGPQGNLPVLLTPAPLTPAPVTQAPSPAAPRTACLEVTPQSGGLLELGALSLEVPAGAVDRPVRLSVTRLLTSSPLNPGLANATAGGGAYRFEPRGQRFTVPVRVSLPFDPGLLRSESALSNLFTYFYDERQRRWERLERIAIDRERCRLTSLAGHFTDLVNATLELPEGPAPILFDVNSIKSLWTGDPNEGVPLPQGLQPGPYGAASFRIPLRLPPGRGDARPELSLQYSSDSLNSWLGRGFDIAAPAVGTDTRFGLPRYDGTDTHLLEGEELVRVGSEGPALAYRARTEKAFRRILRYRGAGEDRWEVTSKSGQVREYGGGEGWLGPERSQRERTYCWYLSKHRDVFGNTVEYDYQYDEANRCTYLREIRYAGFEGDGAREPGAYRVAFELEERPDRRSDSRGRFVSTLAKRLRRVDVYFGDKRVRAYLFEYRANEFGQSVLARCSEEDGAGIPFYAYAFDYHGLRERRDGAGALEGYEGFEPETSWRASYDDNSQGLHDTRTTSAGGSLYIGVELFIWLPFLGKRTVASFGVSGGLNFSSGATVGTLLDLNGDGLPDAAWKEGDALAGYLNRGDGFELSSVFRLPGLEDRLDRESQSSFTFGVSGGLGPLHGGVSAQRSWSEAKTGFADVDGDGFIDFLRAGQSSFARNTGSALVSTPWLSDFSPGPDPSGTDADPAAGTDAEEEGYRRTYYRQEPLRRWKAYRSGALEVSQTGRLAAPEAASRDGLALRTYGAAGEQALILDRMHPEESSVARCPIEENGSLYFHMDTGEQELGDEAEWGVRIRYTGVDFFEELSQAAIFQPVENSVGAPPYGGDARVQPIYRLSSQLLDGAAVSVYTLRQGWQALEQETLTPVFEALAEHGAFVPRRLSRELFEKLYAEASAHAGETLAVPDPEGSGRSLSVTLPRLLLEGYGYVAEKRVFLRLNAYGDEVVKRFLPALSLEERHQAALVPWLGGMRVAPRQEGGGLSYTVAAPSSAQPPAALEPALLPEAAGAAPGSSVLGRGVLLDELWEQAADPDPAERLWLRRGAEGGWRLFCEDQTGEAERSLIVSGQDPLEVLYPDLGVERRFLLSGRTSLLARMPAAVYDGVVSEEVLRGEVFRTDGCTPIPEAAWAALLASVAAEGQAILASRYVLSDGEYRLEEGLSGEALGQVLRVLGAATEVSGSLFDRLPGDPDAARRLVLLTEEELSGFAAGVEAAGWGSSGELLGLFATFSDAQGHGYYLRPDLGLEERARLLRAMRCHRRDAELFPYYRRDPATREWLLKSGLSDPERSRAAQVLSACGLEAWTGLRRLLTYRAGSRLPVATGPLPEGAEEEDWAPRGALAVEPGRETGVVRIPVFDPAGRTVRVRRYVHVFDSGLDYSAEDLVLHPEEYRYADNRQVFAGGVFGWFYGSWVGYHPWNEALLAAQAAPPASPGEADPPPYFEVMRPNTGADGAAAINLDGGGHAVPPEAWIGSVSAYAEAALDEEYRPLTEERKFASFIAGNRLHPSRNGGDAYYRIPRSGTAGDGGELSFLRTSRSKATDVNAGVSLLGLGGNFSHSEGTSWQYRALLDLDGDRYPDAVELADDAGGSSIRVSPGTGRGFAAAYSVSSPFSVLSRYENESFGFGASVGSSAGATKQQIRSTGKVSSTTVQEPQAEGGISLGANGTVASAVQTVGLLDVNGDGLPDHLQRNGSGDFSVALNTGAASFASPASWGAGIAMNLFEGIEGLPSRPEGLSHSSTGSFGASLGVSISAGVAGAGASAGFTGTVSQSFGGLVDVNGDGLADQVAKHRNEEFFRVRFNLGDRFAETETRLFRPEWGFGDAEVLRGAIGSDLSALAGLLGGLALPAGCGIPGYAGLPDSGDNLFQGVVDPFGITDVLDYTGGASFNLGANLTFSIMPFPLVALTLTPGVNGSVASSFTTLRFMDIDGDGLPDHVAKLPNEDFLRVKRNAAGKAGLLKSIRLPQGGTWELDYERAGNTVAMPQCRWVLSRLVKDDGLDAVAPDRGEHRYEENYDYEDGYYDRGERLFYGYARVKSAHADGSLQTVHYHNRSFHARGMVRGSELWGPDAEGVLQRYRETESVVQQRSEGWYEGKEVVFPAVSAETVRVYEPGSTQCAQRRLSYGYDAYGNVARLDDEGDTGRSGDELRARIQYAVLPGYLKQHPESLRVEDAAGRLLRYRQGEYGGRGELLRLHRNESERQYVTVTLSWDRYGNLEAVEDPRGWRQGWEYDATVHAFPVVIRSDNPRRGDPAYVSAMSWDYGTGRELERVDLNGQSLRFRYDSHGRLTEVWSPYDSGATPAVRTEHLTSALPWRTVTHNKLRYDPADTETLETLITVDGLGRVAQTAKRAELWDAGVRRPGWNCSGALAYDGKGRVSAEGQPVFSEGKELPGLAAMRKPTTRSYDALDRLVETVLPDGARLSASYAVADGQAVERNIDPLGNATERMLDSRGNILWIARLEAAGATLTSASYRYNALGEILEAIDQAGNVLRSAYDLMGRRTSLESPDAGLVEYRYDEAGNLISKLDANLRRRGESITYRYDGYNRLEQVDYPRSRDVHYVYGAPGASGHGAGRLLELADESGRVQYRYGRLGEMVAMSRRIDRLTPSAPAVEASYGYLYDYLGRMEQITYPDGEVVHYGYDRGGQVCRVSGLHYGRQTTYIKEIGYDEFGQRSYIEYGNGVRSNYTYDENRRWLSRLHTENRYGTVHQSMSYRFDPVGNVLELFNQAGSYETLQRYGYDALYQLVEAQGTSTYRPYGISESASSYSQQLSYDAIGNLTRKASSARTTPQLPVGFSLNYLLDYKYYEGKPHQAERIGEMWYRYDGNGNLIEEREGGHSTHPLGEAELWRLGEVRVANRGFGLTAETPEAEGVHARYYVWDEENRLKRSIEPELSVEYRYGADGQRAVKYCAQGETLYFDALWQLTTDYPDLRRSKHIYVGSTRVATRLNFAGYPDAGYEEANTYTYHADHLGSVQLVTDPQGQAYERIEYTPYGELWVEQQREREHKIPFRFTAKELDSETGLYYFGARYLDPHGSRWLSPDQAMERYLPEAPISEQARRRNNSLPGEGGVFNHYNLAVYHFSFNSPVVYLDPDGMTGQREYVPEDFRPMQYLGLFEKAPYRDSTPRLSDPYSSQRLKAYSASVSVDLVALVGRLLPVGFASASNKLEIHKVKAAILAQMIVNIFDPDVPVAVSAWIQVDRKKQRIVNWEVSVVGLSIVTSIEAAGSRQGTWQSVEIPDKNAALRILLSNQELLYSLLKQSGVMQE